MSFAGGKALQLTEVWAQGARPERAARSPATRRRGVGVAGERAVGEAARARAATAREPAATRARANSARVMQYFDGACGGPLSPGPARRG